MLSNLYIPFFLLSLLSHEGCAVGMHSLHAASWHAAGMEPNDDTSLLETSKTVLRGAPTAISQQPRPDIWKSATPSDSDEPEEVTGALGDALNDLAEDTENVMADVDDAKSMVEDAVAEVTPDSNLVLGRALSSVQNIRAVAMAKAPLMIHEIHVKSGFKGPLHYPHMHVVNHQVAAKPTVDETTPDVKAFESKVSSFNNDRFVLALVSLALIGLSAFKNLRPRSDKAQGSTAALSDEMASVPAAEKLSVWDGTISTFTSIFGTGFLCLPYAMSLSGWIGAPMIVLFTCCGAYTAHLLTWVLNHEVQLAADRGRKPMMPGWGFLLGIAFGRRAEFAVNTFLMVELWGYVLSGIVATAMNLSQLVADMSVSSAIGITVLVQFVLTTVPGKHLARLNVICNALFVVCCIMFVVTGLKLPAKAPASELKFVKLDGVLAAAGIMVFSPSSHSLYPAIMQHMEDPTSFPTCVKHAYFLAGSAYVVFASCGYYYFGNAAQPSAVANIGLDRNLVALPNLGWMNYVAAFCMVMKCSGLQPLILKPLASTIELMSSGLAPPAVLSTLVTPTVLTLSALAALHFADQIANLLNLLGCIFCMNIAFVLPVLCYWKMNAHNIGGIQKAAFVGLIAMGASMAMLGLITTLDD